MDSKRVLLIDLSSLFHVAFRALAPTDPLAKAMDVTLSQVRRCTKDGDWHVGICCDAKGNWRKDLDSTYKAHREKLPEVFYAEFESTKARLQKDGYLLWECPGFEADDLIATAATAALALGHGVRIASTDKDLLQLVGPRVDCLRTHTWTVVGEKEFREKFQIEPSQFGDWLALVGDKSDGIAGVPGVGRVAATKLLARAKNLAGIWEALETVPESLATPAIVKSLSTNVIATERARRLIELRTDAPIDFGEIFGERKCQPLVNQESSDMDEPDAEYVDSVAEQGQSPGPGLPESTDNTEGSSKSNTTTDVVQPVTALVAPDYNRGLEPMSIGQAYKLAKGLYESRLYQRFQNPEAIMAVMIRGREMGLGALTALDAFHVIEGKPAPHAYLIIARAKEDPDCEYFQCIDTTADGATWETKNKHNPQPTRLRYTLAQAQAAGIVKPGSNWTKRPDEMCRKTAGAQLARMEYPASALGLYAWEELDA